MLDLTATLTAFTTLFVIIDPIGLSPLFLTLTRGYNPALRRRIAFRACGIALGILLVFALFGERILEVIGISMPAFRIAGGILLFLTALDMLFERRQTRRKDQAEGGQEEHQDDPSAFPLAIPLLAGPGAIATVILLVGEARSTLDVMLVIAVMILVLALVLVLFFLASPLEKALGKTGIAVATRLMGMLLAALAIQFILDGVAGFGAGLTIIRGGK